MTYKMPDHCKDAVTNPAVFPDKQIEERLHQLRSYGPEHYDRPRNSFEESTGNDYEGYTRAWINLLGAEQDRRKGLS